MSEPTKTTRTYKADGRVEVIIAKPKTPTKTTFDDKGRLIHDKGHSRESWHSYDDNDNVVFTRTLYYNVEGEVTSSNECTLKYDDKKRTIYKKTSYNGKIAVFTWQYGDHGLVKHVENDVVRYEATYNDDGLMIKYVDHYHDTTTITWTWLSADRVHELIEETEDNRIEERESDPRDHHMYWRTVTAGVGSKYHTVERYDYEYINGNRLDCKVYMNYEINGNLKVRTVKHNGDLIEYECPEYTETYEY